MAKDSAAFKQRAREPGGSTRARKARNLEKRGRNPKSPTVELPRIIQDQKRNALDIKKSAQSTEDIRGETVASTQGARTMILPKRTQEIPANVKTTIFRDRIIKTATKISKIATLTKVETRVKIPTNRVNANIFLIRRTQITNTKILPTKLVYVGALGTIERVPTLIFLCQACQAAKKLVPPSFTPLPEMALTFVGLRFMCLFVLVKS